MLTFGHHGADLVAGKIGYHHVVDQCCGSLIAHADTGCMFERDAAIGGRLTEIDAQLFCEHLVDIRHAVHAVVETLGQSARERAGDTLRLDTLRCIRCASCVGSCPCGLLPLEMAAHARTGDLDGTAKLGLMDCIACGSCSFVCPSNIPLVQYFRIAKAINREVTPPLLD